MQAEKTQTQRRRRRTCAVCRTPLEQSQTGRPKLYCSSARRQRAHHAKASKAPAFRKQDWGTPRKLWEPLHQEHEFGLAAAAHSQNTLLPNWLGPGHEDPPGKTRWRTRTAELAPPGKSVWLNPPFASVGPWTQRCAATARRGVPVVVLVAVATSAA